MPKKNSAKGRVNAKAGLQVALRLTWLLVLAAAVAGVILFARHRPGNGRPGKQAKTGKLPPVVEPEPQAQAAYAGSSSCKDCHQEAYELWATSNHRHAERRPQPELDQHAFEPARSFQHGTQTTSVLRDGDRYEIVSVGLSKHPGTNVVARVIGHDPLRQFLCEAPGGRYQAMEAAFDPLRREWFNVYGKEDRQPGEWGHWTGRGMNWNDMCAGCHNTRLRKNYEPASDTYRTTMAEMSVGCEACHGPLRAHNDW